MSRVTPEFYIDDVHSKDYEPFLQGDTELDPISSLKNHAITSPSQNLTDVITRRLHRKKNGKLVEVERVLRAAQELSVTYTIVTGPFVESPILRKARDESGCTTTIFLLYLCPENDGENHVYIFADGIMNPPVRVNDPFPIDETTLAEWQFEFRIEAEILLKEALVFKSATEANDDALYAVSFLSADCVNCGDTVNQTLLATGGDGTADLVMVKSTDRLASLSVIATPAPTGSVGSSLWTDGNIALAGFMDLAKGAYGEVTGPATGGTMYSNDGGDTWSLDTDVTLPVSAVNSFAGQLIAGGGADDAAAWFATSENGLAWTQVVSAVLPTDEAITDIAVDDDNEEIFVVTQAGRVFKGFYQGDNIVFAELSGLPAPLPAKMFSVDVHRAGRIMVGGAGGYVAESLDSGLTWTQRVVSGTNDMFAVDGKKWRTMIGNGNVLQERSVLPYSNNNFVTLTPQNAETISGNITGVAKTLNDENELHYWAYVTDTGQSGFVRDDSPFS